jgi:putative aldouronate transport system substrate-binding protein
MSRKVRKSTAVAIALIMLISVLAACSKKENASSNTPSASSPAASESDSSDTAVSPPEEVTLEFFMPSGTANVNDLQAVLDQFYENTKDTLNTKINFNFTTFDNIGQQVSLKIAGSEQVDSA